MKKSLLAAGLALGLVSGPIWAGGIQIDPTGTGSEGQGEFLDSLGNLDAGDVLLRNLVPGGVTGTIYSQIEVSAGILGGEITFVFSMPASSTLSNPGFNNDITLASGGAGSVLELYWDPLGASIDAGSNALSGVVADHATGAGFDDGILLARGSVRIDSILGMSLRETGTGLLAIDGFAGTGLDVDTVPLDGGSRLNVAFNSSGSESDNSAYVAPAPVASGLLWGSDTAGFFVDTDYVVNGIDTLVVDLVTGGDLSAAYATHPSATSVAGQTSLSQGIDLNGGGGPHGTAVNDLNCEDSLLLGLVCDVQVQTATNLSFTAKEVPEPGSLALLGLALGLVGVRYHKSRG